jgi:membrane-associated phospholipid phosphatase
MNNGLNFAQLLRRTLVALFLCAALVALCYFFVDRPVAFFVHNHRFADDRVLKWVTYLPPALQTCVPLLLAAFAVRRAWGPWRRWEQVVVVACISLLLAEQFRGSLAYAFGRYWPETWINGNPSLIGDGAYGFHPFHHGIAYDSFPSGHTARTVAVATVVWIAYPRWRWACGLACLAVALDLLALDYHFVGDLIAGGFVGGIVAAYAARWQFSAAPPR